MPKGSKLDRCVEHIKQGYLEKGKTKQEASNIAWAACKKQAKDKLAKK